MVKEETLFASVVKYNNNGAGTIFTEPQNMSKSIVNKGDNNDDHSYLSTLNNDLVEMEYSRIGRIIKTALLRAQAESRVIVGFSGAINALSKTPERSLLCLMAVPQDGDSATHMHEVLLEAFCYENDIYVIKVDCPTKLSRMLGKNTIESCCLIQKTTIPDNNIGNTEDTNGIESELLNKPEALLVDYCEAFWDSPHASVVELPAV